MAGGPFGATRRRLRGNEGNNLRPGYRQFRLVEVLALARPLGLALKSGSVHTHLFHTDTVPHPLVTNGDYTDLP